MKNLFALLNDESGATAIEYALIAALISIAAIIAMTSTGNQVNGTFNDVKNTLKNAREAH